MFNVDTAKNREREAHSFANINLLGRCNVDCFFCLGKDLAGEIEQHNKLLRQHFHLWRRFKEFLRRCESVGIEKLYVTGQNTDSLLYPYLEQLIRYLHERGFKVGLRTNGYRAEAVGFDIINSTELSVGYSIHTLKPWVNKLIMGRSDLPDWRAILPATRRPRVSIVLNRHNALELFEILAFIAHFDNVRYVQVRRVSTDDRERELLPDIRAYDEVYDEVSRRHGPPVRVIFGDAEVYRIFGMDVVFWRTVKTTANSMNYFIDGTISDEYFIVEGYRKNRESESRG